MGSPNKHQLTISATVGNLNADGFELGIEGTVLGFVPVGRNACLYYALMIGTVAKRAGRQENHLGGGFHQIYGARGGIRGKAV